MLLIDQTFSANAWSLFIRFLTQRQEWIGQEVSRLNSWPMRGQLSPVISRIKYRAMCRAVARPRRRRSLPEPWEATSSSKLTLTHQQRPQRSSAAGRCDAVSAGCSWRKDDAVPAPLRLGDGGVNGCVGRNDGGVWRGKSLGFGWLGQLFLQLPSLGFPEGVAGLVLVVKPARERRYRLCTEVYGWTMGGVATGGVLTGGLNFVMTLIGHFTLLGKKLGCHTSVKEQTWTDNPYLRSAERSCQ